MKNAVEGVATLSNEALMSMKVGSIITANPLFWGICNEPTILMLMSKNEEAGTRLFEVSYFGVMLFETQLTISEEGEQVWTYPTA